MAFNPLYFKEINDHAVTSAADYFLEVFILVCVYICQMKVPGSKIVPRQGVLGSNHRNA